MDFRTRNSLNTMCPYTGHDVTAIQASKEHVIPKAFFTKGWKDYEPLTLKADLATNNAGSVDENFVAPFITAGSRYDDPNKQDEVLERFLGHARQNRRAANLIFKEVISRTWDHVEVKVDSEVRNAMQRVMLKMLRGLFMYFYDRYLSPDLHSEVTAVAPMFSPELRTFCKTHFKSENVHSVKGGEVVIHHAPVEGSEDNTFWVLVFHNQLTVLMLTCEPSYLNRLAEVKREREERVLAEYRQKLKLLALYWLSTVSPLGMYQHRPSKYSYYGEYRVDTREFARLFPWLWQAGQVRDEIRKATLREVSEYLSDVAPEEFEWDYRKPPSWQEVHLQSIQQLGQGFHQKYPSQPCQMLIYQRQPLPAENRRLRRSKGKVSPLPLSRCLGYSGVSKPISYPWSRHLPETWYVPSHKKPEWSREGPSIISEGWVRTRHRSGFAVPSSKL